MDVFEAIQKRKSVRSYEDKPVSKETLVKLLEAARVAPSAKNVQPLHFIVVTDKEKREELSKGIFAKWLTNAPVVIAACGDTKASPKWYTVDTALALENMVLAATGEGLGTCCVGSFDESEVKKRDELVDETFQLTRDILLKQNQRKHIKNNKLGKVI